MPNNSPIHFGWAPYWNMLPLKQELTHKIGAHVEYTLGHPSEINLLTRTKVVDAAPSSSICLLKYPEMTMPVPVGIAACKEVQSVYIGLNKKNDLLMEHIEQRLAYCKKAFTCALERHPQDLRSAAKLALKTIFEKQPKLNWRIPTIYFTTASETSVGLARLIWRFLFGRDVFSEVEKASSTYHAQLLIGDEALEKRPLFVEKLDLATLWNQMTNLPFVFAVLQSAKTDMSSSHKEKIMQAAELAQARMTVEPSCYFSTPMPRDVQGHTIDLAAYWKTMHYRLTRQDLKGLMLFLSLICESQPQKSYVLTNKLVTLQDLELST